MTKKIFTIFVLFIVLCSFRAGFFHQTLGDLAAIDFPDKPQTIDTLGQHVHHYSDSSGFYLAGLSDLNKNGAGFSHNELDSLYSGFIGGTLKTSKGELVSKKPYHLDGLQGYEIKYVTNNPNLSNLRFKRILFLNSQMLYVDFWTDKDKDEVSKPARERFFNSLKITANKASRQQGTSNMGNIAFGLGYIVGQAIVWVVLAGVILVIVFFIINRNKKRPL
ncbi:hypothetical protein [Pedobacter sp. P26]|uniref:hypothetical protein n=1 Tax=Pedobacter sp. P26 TaxID=3423956 RepID=UPI003D66F089